MSHEISVQNGVAEAAFAYSPAWHGLGTLVKELMTVDEARDEAHLNWTVEKHPLYFGDGSLVPDKVAVRRSDNDFYLGTVGNDWVPVQNEEQARFIEALTGEGAAVVECVGALREGRRTFWTVRVPGEVVLPNGDKIQKYLIVCNGHDGSLAFRAFWSPVRVVCSNTLNISFRDAKDGIALFHRSKVMDHLEEARKILGLANAYYAQLGKKFEVLLDKAFSDAEFKLYVDEVVPPTAKDKKKDGGYTKLERQARKSIVTNFYEGRGHEMAGRTAWGAYNAVTEYLDHQKEYTSNSRKFENLLIGGTKELQQKAYNVAHAMATA